MQKAHLHFPIDSDRLFDALSRASTPQPPTPEALTDRIMEAIEQTPQQSKTVRHLSWSGIAAALFAVTAFGTYCLSPNSPRYISVSKDILHYHLQIFNHLESHPEKKWDALTYTLSYDHLQQLSHETDF